jgi:hypothetical protein
VGENERLRPQQKDEHSKAGRNLIVAAAANLFRQRNEQVLNESDCADFCADRLPKQRRSAWFPHWSPSPRWSM